MCRFILLLFGFLIIFQSVANVVVAANAEQVIHIAYLTREQMPSAAISNLDPFVPNKGFDGAQLAILDTNTTGKFTHQNYVLHPFTLPADGSLVDIVTQQIAGKFDLLIVLLPSQDITALADLPAAKAMLIFDAASRDDALRNEACRANVLHLLPSRAMRADALGQYLMKKRWHKWFLVVGPTPEDQLAAEALKRAAKRFNMKIVAEKNWEHTADARRTAQADVAVFSQVDEDYDVLVVADEQGLFGEYLDYRTWIPRPIVGTQGLTATAWHPTHDQWGASQIQNRFQALAGRWMSEQDYGAYLAVRAIGEAATRTHSNQLQPIRDYLLSDKLALQGYKGNPLSFRAWDGQLRQPILLAAPRSLVAVAPIEGFLHPTTELDTLGADQPESHCHWNH